MNELINKRMVLEAIRSLPVTLDAETVQKCIEAVSNSKAIDAIPVEWIVDYMNRFGFSFAEDIIKRMLEVWEEEIRASRWMTQ